MVNPRNEAGNAEEEEDPLYASVTICSDEVMLSYNSTRPSLKNVTFEQRPFCVGNIKKTFQKL